MEKETKIMRIQHNIMAMNAYRNYTKNTSALSKNLEKLSSGYKINRAGDDAAGLAISEKMRAQITGLEAAQKNVKDGISLVNTAEGAMQEVQDMLNRMVYLAQQSANGTYDNEVDRKNLQAEVDQLNSEIDRIADASNFNGIKLLDGSLGLNTKAFEITSAEAAEETNVPGLFGDLPDAGDTKITNTILHTDSVEGKMGEFTLDFSQIVKEADGAANAAITIEIGTLNGDLAATDSTTAVTGEKIAAELASTGNTTFKGYITVKADGTMVFGTDTNAGSIMYKATDNGDGTVTYKLEKYLTAASATVTPTNDSDVKSDISATAAAALLNVNVSVTDKTGDGELKGTENVSATKIKQTVRPEAGKLANTVLDFDVSKLEDGMKITIGSKTVTVALGSDSANKSATDKLDLTMYSQDELDDNKADVIDKMTVALAGNGYFTVGQTADNKISLSEIGDATSGATTLDATHAAELTSVDKIAALLKVTKPAANAKTDIKITKANIAEGDTLTIGGKQYMFTKDVSATAPANTVLVDINDPANSLQSKLSADKLSATVNGDTVTITAKTADDDPVEVLGKGLTLQIGDSSDSYNQLSVRISDIHAAKLGVKAINISTQSGAQAAVDVIKNAINQISAIRGTLGATSNRLDHTSNNLSVMRENIQDAESTIRDTDVAEEMMSYTKNNILVQSAQAMLAQANQVPQGVLQLLQ